jgi:broad specificity phosphatase PhoE
MGRLILVRHGESTANRDRCFTITDDVPLTELGRQQARETALLIAKRFEPARVISSTFARARQTAEIIAAELGLETEVVADLHERNFGSLKGQPYEAFTELVLRDPSYDAAKDWLWRPDGGESQEDVRSRVVAVIEQVRARYLEQDIVVVSHGAVMRCVWAHLQGSWKDAYLPPNGGIVAIEHYRDAFRAPRIIED